jgi:hypothetical protein
LVFTTINRFSKIRKFQSLSTSSEADKKSPLKMVHQR